MRELWKESPGLEDRLQKASNRDFRRKVNKTVNRSQELRQAAFSEISAGLSAVHLHAPFTVFLIAALELLEVRRKSCWVGCLTSFTHLFFFFSFLLVSDS